MYKGPSKNSGLVENASWVENVWDKAEWFFADTSVPGWVQLESRDGFAPSGWVQSDKLDMAFGDVKNLGRQFILNLGANVPDIIRQWGPAVAVNDFVEIENGYTRLAFDGLAVEYNNYAELTARLTRKGAGIGGIFIDTEGYDKEYIKSIYGDILEIETGSWGEHWSVNGSWDGWWYKARLAFNDRGLVNEIHFMCDRVNLGN